MKSKNKIVIKTFITKKGEKAIIRYPTLGDLEKMTAYINTLSKEDTYVTFSGEQLTLNEEREFLVKTLKQIEGGDKVFLCCFLGVELAGVSNVDRNVENRKRARHIGKFGLSVASNYRDEGVGFELARATIEEARAKMPSLKMIELEVYDINKTAKNLYKKLGFTEVGTIPEAILYKDKYVGDTIMYLKL